LGFTKKYTDNVWDLINEASNAGYSHILLMGDFNLSGINWDTWSCKGDVNRTEHKLLETLQNNFLFQHISKPTTWRGSDTPHILDLKIINEENMISDIE
jgi:exonuclease III